MIEEIKRILVCTSCGTEFKVSVEDYQQLETVECPGCGTDCYTDKATVRYEDIDPDGYDLDKDLDFN